MAHQYSMITFTRKLWTTKQGHQGQNSRIMLHVFPKKFREKQDARNENFEKRLLSEILMFFVSANSNVRSLKNQTLLLSSHTH